MAERKTETKETLDQPGSVALFDVDQTLIEGYTVFPFAAMLADKGVIDWKVVATLKRDRKNYERHQTTYQEFANNVVTHYCQGLEGKSQKEVEEVGNMFMAYIRPVMLCSFSRDLTKLMNRHAQTVMVSGSPIEALRPLADYLQISKVYGMEAEISDGYYTGRVKRNLAVRGEKEHLVASLVTAGFTRSTSFAFGDSDSDIPILEAVANPFAVNPRGNLSQIAKDRGWNIVESKTILSEVKTQLKKLGPNQQ